MALITGACAAAGSEWPWCPTVVGQGRRGRRRSWRRKWCACAMRPNHFTLQPTNWISPSEEKLADIVTPGITAATGVSSTPKRPEQTKRLARNWAAASLPVCVAKTQYSFSDNPKLLGAPEGFTVTVRQREAVRRRGLYGGPHRGYHDHARPAQGARRRGASTWTKRATSPAFLIFFEDTCHRAACPIRRAAPVYVSGVKE